VLCRLVGVGTRFLLFLLFLVNIVGSMVSSSVYRDYMYMYTWLINIQCATLYKCSVYIYGRFIDLRLHTI
jgi:uncharacterized membrane protein